ncbi:MAG: hypothetical protein KatS3mg121_0910 [Gammaproteobacteria bacterium]|nr:MAG: hypothetical protein KatS3mg121_0910 [Gammaproteobacteria bacterium]
MRPPRDQVLEYHHAAPPPGRDRRRLRSVPPGPARFRRDRFRRDRFRRDRARRDRARRDRARRGRARRGRRPPAETRRPPETAPAETAPAETASAETASAETASAETAPAQAADTAPSWTGQGGLGWIVNRGNSDNASVNGKFDLSRLHGGWSHRLGLTMKRVEERATITAERYLFTAKTEYRYSHWHYAFVSARYDDDRFDGFDYQASLTTGLGWHLIDRDTQHLDVELGAGRRQNRPADTGPTQAETIWRLAQHHDLQLGADAQWFQDLLVEASERNTASELTFGLKVAVNSHLALEVSHGIKHNSDPPPSADPAVEILKTDRTTRITLVFGFGGTG